MPLVAILILGDALGEERRSGFLRLTLSRSRHRLSYSATRVWHLIMMTITIMAAGFVVTGLLAFLLFPDRLPDWQMIRGTPYFVPRHMASVKNLPAQGRALSQAFFPGFFHSLLFHHPLLYLLLVTGVSLLAALAMSLTALCVSVATSNVYGIVAGPWALYVLVSILMEATGHMTWAPLIMAGPYLSTPATPVNTNGIPFVWMGIDVILAGLFLILFRSKKRGDVFD